MFPAPLRPLPRRFFVVMADAQRLQIFRIEPQWIVAALERLNVVNVIGQPDDALAFAVNADRMLFQVPKAQSPPRPVIASSRRARALATCRLGASTRPAKSAQRDPATSG